jgi:hypothetical protein
MHATGRSHARTRSWTVTEAKHESLVGRINFVKKKKLKPKLWSVKNIKVF